MEDLKTKLLCPVGSCFAPTSASNRKLITAFHNLTVEPHDNIFNNNEPYFVVPRLYPKQSVDANAISVNVKCDDYSADWAVLTVDPSYKPELFQFIDTISLRRQVKTLSPVTVASTRLNTIYCKIGLHQANPDEFMESTVSGVCRVDHVFSKTMQMDRGVYKGSSGGVMIDRDECAVTIHVDSVNEVTHDTKRMKISDVASNSSDSHASFRNGSIIFYIQPLVDELSTVQIQCTRIMSCSFTIPFMDEFYCNRVSIEGY